MADSTKTTRAKILRSAIWTTNSKVLAQGMAFVTTIILTRLLDTSDFGLMAMAATFMGLIDNFIDLGFLSAIIQAKELNSKQLSGCFWLLLGICLLACGGIAVTAPYIADLFAERRLTELIRFLSLTFLFVPLNILCKGILSRDLHLDVIAKMELYSGIFKMIASIIFAYLGMGVWSLAYAYLLEKILLSVTVAMAAKWYPSFDYDTKSVNRLLNFGLHTTAGSLLWYLYTRADIFVIGRLLGAEVLGVYSIASQLPRAISALIPTTWNRIAYPLFSRYQNSPRLPEVVLKSSSILAFVCLPIFLGLAAMAPDVIKVLFGERWQAAVFPLQMLAIVGAIETVSGMLPSVLTAIGRPGINAVINAGATIIFPLALYSGALKWGMTGVLWISVVLYSYRYTTYLYFTCKLIGIRISTYAKHHIYSVVSASIMFLLLTMLINLQLNWNIYARMTFCVISGMLIYGVLQWVLNRRLISELLSYVKTA